RLRRLRVHDLSVTRKAPPVVTLRPTGARSVGRCFLLCQLELALWEDEKSSISVAKVYGALRRRPVKVRKQSPGRMPRLYANRCSRYRARRRAWRGEYPGPVVVKAGFRAPS